MIFSSNSIILLKVFELQHMVRETEAVLDEDGMIIDTKAASKNAVTINKKDSVVCSTDSALKDDHVCPQCKYYFNQFYTNIFIVSLITPI